MVEYGHKAVVLDSNAVIAFVRSLRPDADALARDTGLKFGTVEKWYRAKAIEPSATSLLRVVIALNAEARFFSWLAEFQPNTRTMRVAERPPDPPAAPSENVKPAASGKPGKRHAAGDR